MKRRLSLVLLVLFELCPILAPMPAAAKDGQVTVLTLSQLQSQLLPFTEKVNRDTVFMGGLSHAAGV